jgi:hypothetical protein
MMIRSFADVLALWTPLQLSRVLNVRYQTAAAMHRRGSIGPAHWARLIEAAASRGEIITAEMLVKFANDRRLASLTKQPPAASDSIRHKPQSASSVQAP